MALDKYSAGTTLIKMSEVSCVRLCHQLYLFSVLTCLLLFRLVQDLGMVQTARSFIYFILNMNSAAMHIKSNGEHWVGDLTAEMPALTAWS